MSVRARVGLSGEGLECGSEGERVMCGEESDGVRGRGGASGICGWGAGLMRRLCLRLRSFRHMVVWLMRGVVGEVVGGIRKVLKGGVSGSVVERQKNTRETKNVWGRVKGSETIFCDFF